jgi:hypothetical protein
VKYIVIDLVSKFYVAVDPTPKIPFLLRERRDDGTAFENRDEALATLEKAAAYLAPHYSDLELVVRPARATQHPSKRQNRTTRSVWSSNSRSWDPADGVNQQLEWMRKYDQDLN